jgi:hypothetical protein
MCGDARTHRICVLRQAAKTNGEGREGGGDEVRDPGSCEPVGNSVLADVFVVN